MTIEGKLRLIAKLYSTVVKTDQIRVSMNINHEGGSCTLEGIGPWVVTNGANGVIAHGVTLALAVDNAFSEVRKMILAERDARTSDLKIFVATTNQLLAIIPIDDVKEQ